MYGPLRLKGSCFLAPKLSSPALAYYFYFSLLYLMIFAQTPVFRQSSLFLSFSTHHPSLLRPISQLKMSSFLILVCSDQDNKN